VAPPESDKVVHIVLFGGLAALWAWSLRAWRGRALVVVAAAVALYGGLLELAQGLTTYRTADWNDFFADAIGCAVAGALVRLVAAVRSRT
jgi:VanZ family protein